MIVVCPACRTRYRHARTDPGSAATARCSRCDERFPLRTRQPYLVMPLSGSGPVGIGLPEPVMAAAAAIPAVSDIPAAIETEPSQVPLRSLASRDGLMAFLLGSVGLFAGYHASLWQGGDLMTWTLGGAGAGLVLGWAWFRWRARKH